MSDPDAAPDPVDQAYARAEAMLSDDAARAARRARVLAAVAREPASAPATTAPARRPAWRRGGWLAAASVAGLSVLVATQIYRPVPQPRPAQAAPPPPARPGIATSPAAPVRPSAGPPLRIVPSAPPTAKPPPAEALPPAPIVAAPLIAPAAQALPTEPFPPPPPPPPSEEVVVTASRQAPPPPSAIADVDVASRRQTPAPAAAPPAAPSSLAPSSDPAARLRAAAGAGRTTEVAALLDQGVFVDDPDVEGETALMKSIRAGRPGPAALLLRRGASLDRRNHAGRSARDMAAAKGDARLNQALGLAP